MRTNIEHIDKTGLYFRNIHELLSVGDDQPLK